MFYYVESNITIGLHTCNDQTVAESRFGCEGGHFVMGSICRTRVRGLYQLIIIRIEICNA